MASTKKVLIYGGSGALGDSIVKYFKAKNYVSLSILNYDSLYILI